MSKCFWGAWQDFIEAEITKCDKKPQLPDGVVSAQDAMDQVQGASANPASAPCSVHGGQEDDPAQPDLSSMTQVLTAEEPSGTAIVSTPDCPQRTENVGAANVGPLLESPPDSGPDQDAQPVSLGQIDRMCRFPIKGKRQRKKSAATWDVSTNRSKLDFVDPDNQKASGAADIQATIGKQHHLQVVNGHIIDDPWGEFEGQECDDEEFLLGGACYEKYIAHWLRDIHPLEEPIDFKETLGEDHCLYDIDPANGAVVGPIEQPITHRSNEGVNESVLWRSQNLSSSLLIFREMAVRRKKEETKIKQLQEQEQERVAAWVEAREAAREEAIAIKPNVPCVFRPATLEDMQGAAEVYNKEIDAGHHAVDMRLLSAGEMVKVLKTCEAEKLPFIVAVYQNEEIIEPMIFTTDEARMEYLEFKRWKESQKPGHLQESTGKVLGFAFSTEFAVGLTGEKEGLSRFSAKISLFVHPEYRGKKIGKVLLNQMLTLHSTRYGVVPGYKWEAGPSPGVYGERYFTPRDLHLLYIQGHYPTDGDDGELEWHDKFLDFYEFEQAARLKKCLRDKNAEWLDLVLWVHQCQPTGIMSRKHLRAVG